MWNMDKFIMTEMTIGRLAEASGVGVETVRFYERKGLIEQPPKPREGFRRYPPEMADRIRFIRQAQELGFSLSEIADLLTLKTIPGTDCGDIREQAVTKLANVDRKIETLARIRGALTEVIAACPGEGGLECCSIIEAMERKETEMNTVTLHIEGMTCDSCAERLRRVLTKEQGVRSAEASHADDTATVTFNPDAVSEDRLREVIARAGFTVVGA